MWWAYTRGGLIFEGAYSRRFAVYKHEYYKRIQITMNTDNYEFFGGIYVFL